MALKDWRKVNTVNVAKWENKKNGHTLTIGEMIHQGQYSYTISLWTGSDLEPVANAVQKQNAIKEAKRYMSKH